MRKRIETFGTGTHQLRIPLFRCQFGSDPAPTISRRIDPLSLVGRSLSRAAGRGLAEAPAHPGHPPCRLPCHPGIPRIRTARSHPTLAAAGATARSDAGTRLLHPRWGGLEEDTA